jgi:xylan 1,4-beta-xylosidase
VDYGALKFSYSMDGEIWTPIGPIFDASTLADESCREGRFTGAFVGMTCQDPEQEIDAAFDYFIYDPQ